MKSIIIGAGKYGEVYLSYLKAADIDVIGFLDDDPKVQKQTLDDVPVIGPISLLNSLKESHGVECVYCPLGNNNLRVKFLNKSRELGYITPNFIHPDVKISPDVTIAEEGVYILGNTFIMPHVRIERDVMISVGANIIHHTVLNQGVFVSNGVNLGASINVESRAYIGMGSTVMTGVTTVGEESLIGAGAVVIRAVPKGGIMTGVPAKLIKFKPEYDLQLIDNQNTFGGGKSFIPNCLAA